MIGYIRCVPAEEDKEKEEEGLPSSSSFFSFFFFFFVFDMGEKERLDGIPMVSERSEGFERAR